MNFELSNKLAINFIRCCSIVLMCYNYFYPNTIYFYPNKK